MITLFGLANASDHAANLGLVSHDLGHPVALGVVAMMIALIGGRIVPSFTRNWLAKNGERALPAAFGSLGQGSSGGDGARPALDNKPSIPR